MKLKATIAMYIVLAATLTWIPNLQAFASNTSSGSLVINMVIPPMMSLTRNEVGTITLPLEHSGDLAMTQMKVAANHRFELSVSSKGFAGETIKLNGKKIILSAEGSRPIAFGDAEEQTIALAAPAGFGKRSRNGTIQFVMVYP